jgi:hypothetical protein
MTFEVELGTKSSTIRLIKGLYDIRTGECEEGELGTASATIRLIKGLYDIRTGECEGGAGITALVNEAIAGGTIAVLGGSIDNTGEESDSTNCDEIEAGSTGLTASIKLNSP